MEIVAEAGGREGRGTRITNQGGKEIAGEARGKFVEELVEEIEVAYGPGAYF